VLLLAMAMVGCTAAAPTPTGQAPGGPASAAQPPAPAAATSQPAGAPPGAPKPNPTVLAPLASEPRALKVGSMLTVGLAPFAIARSRGYFNQEGLTVELVTFTNEAELVPALAAGQIDAALSVAPSAALVNAVARGTALKIVASNGTIKPHRNIGNIMVRKDLAPAGGYLDLKTLKPPIRAGAAAEGSLAHAVVLLEAEKAGFRISDVSMAYLGQLELNAALQSGQLDLAASVEPLITIAEQQGVAVRWREMAEDFPDVPYSTVVYGPSLLSKDFDTGVRLMRAYLQGVRDYEDAVAKNRDRDAIVALLADPLKASLPVIAAMQDAGGLAFVDPNGMVSIDTLKPVLDLWVRTGLVQSGFDLSRLIEPAPSKTAVQNMGVYQ